MTPHAFRRQCRPALGTFVDIALHEDDLPPRADDRQAVFDAAFAQIDEVQRQMSFHDPGSALSRINRAMPGSRIEVPQLTREVISIALELFAVTDGLFDADVGGHLVSHGLLPDHGAGARPMPCGGPAGLRLDADGCVTVTRTVCLDLGGIAKGFAVDRAVEAIGAMGVARCIVNAGGDLRAAGETAAKVVVRRPDMPGALLPLGEISDGAVATSAPYFSLEGAGRAARCALFDPSGASLTALRSYTVLAPTCVLADALTKAVAVAVHRRSGSAGGDCAPQAFTRFHADFLDAFHAQAYIL